MVATARGHVLLVADPPEQQHLGGERRRWRDGSPPSKETVVEGRRNDARSRKGRRLATIRPKPAAIAAADTNDRVGQAHHPALEPEHGPADRPAEATEPAVEHLARDVVVADQHPAALGCEEQLRPGRVVAVEMEDVLRIEALAIGPEPAPEAEIKAQKIRGLGDIGDVRRAA
jgi:hypothetical protein